MSPCLCRHSVKCSIPQLQKQKMQIMHFKFKSVAQGEQTMPGKQPKIASFVGLLESFNKYMLLDGRCSFYLGHKPCMSIPAFASLYNTFLVCWEFVPFRKGNRRRPLAALLSQKICAPLQCCLFHGSFG